MPAGAGRGGGAGSLRTAQVVGLQAQVAGDVPDQEKDQQPQHQHRQPLQQKSGAHAVGLDDPGDQRGDKDGGHAAARGGQPQSQAPPVPEPVAHRQGEGDHAAVAVGQTGEGPAAQ